MNLKHVAAPLLALFFGLSFLFYGLFSKDTTPPVKHPSKPEKWKSWSVEQLEVDTTLSSPQLMVKNQQELSVPLNTRSLHIETEIHGNFAETRLDLEFENQNDRILEGTFYFPLAEKQLISDFQLEVNGKMCKGVIVDKELGRVAFESTVRRKVDPGLLELTKGNAFKARVYPIPAKGTKKISISYVEELTTRNGTNMYFLPLNYQGEPADYTCSISVDDLGQQISDKQNRYTLSGNRFVAKTKLRKIKPGEGIRLVQQGLNESQSVMAKSPDGQVIVQTSLKPESPKKRKRKVTSVSILLDVSASSEKRDFEKEKAVIGNYLEYLSHVDVQLIVFSNEVHQTNWRTITGKSDIRRLMEELDYQKPDGGTQLGCIRADQVRGEEVLLLSDCLSNLGKDALPKWKNKRVYVISSTPELDTRSAQLTAQNGGEFINLNHTGLTESIQKLKYEPLQFLGISGAKGITTGIGSFTGTNFTTYTKMKSVPEEFTLLFGRQGKVTERIRLKKSELREWNTTGLLSKFWSSNRVKELDLYGEKHKEEIVRLAKENQLISPYTSLIVLDALEDYLQYRIVPPLEMRKEYYKRLKELKAVETEADREVETKEHQTRVLKRFEELVNWWKTEFDPAPLKPEAKEKERGQESHTENRAFLEPQVASDQDAPLANEEATGTYNLSMTSVGATSTFANADMASVTYQMSAPVTANGSVREAKVALSNWDPKTPYLRKLKSAGLQNVYETYLELKKDYRNQPSFYVDVSDYLLSIGKKQEAIRVLSNISELETENPQMLRILAHRYEQLEAYELAISVFEAVKKMRPEEPQSYRDLALVYELNQQYRKAFNELKYVITHSWDERFRDIENICLVELNHLAARHRFGKGLIHRKLLRDMPVDMRVVIDWDSDNCDIDLWVTDPLGEKCFYSNSLTRAGGRISMDCTGGYGPEEFMVRKALKGKYRVQANYFGSSAQTLSGLTTIQVKLITNYGRKNEKTRSITRRLAEKKDVIDLAELEF